jgi:hypothetical protein
MPASEPLPAEYRAGYGVFSDVRHHPVQLADDSEGMDVNDDHIAVPL